MTKLLALLALALLTRAHRIKHVVVLYEENRAFDHLLGHQKQLHVDGLRGDESNPVSLKDPSKGKVIVFDGAPYVVQLGDVGNISAVPRLVYHDAFPVARLSFLNLSLYAYSSLSPPTQT